MVDVFTAWRTIGQVIAACERGPVDPDWVMPQPEFDLFTPKGSGNALKAWEACEWFARGLDLRRVAKRIGAHPVSVSRWLHIVGVREYRGRHHPPVERI